jgi:hypothetical protein
VFSKVKIMAVTVIDKAKELISEVGEKQAIAYFEDRINKIGTPFTFEMVCRVSGLETAIDFIKNRID